MAPKTLLCLICIPLILITTPGLASDSNLQLTPGEKAWIDQHHTVRVRIGNAPPFMFTEGKIQGIAIDYLTYIFTRHGIKLQYIAESDVTWPEALEYIKQHRVVDMVPTAKITDERKKYMVFTDDYIFAPWVIFTRLDAGFISSMEDLKGKTVSVEEGFVIHEKLKREYPDIKLKVVSAKLKNYAEIPVRDLSTGLVDAYIGNLFMTTYMIHSKGYTNIKVAAPTPFENHNQAMAIRSDWPELAGIINKTLAAMPPDDHAAIRNKWLAIRYEYGINKIDVIKWVSGVAGVASVFIMFFLFWNRRLKAEVDARKEIEAILRDRENLLNDVGVIAKIGGWEMDPVTRAAKWTKGTYDIVEIEMDQPIPGMDDHIAYYLPEYQAVVEEAMATLIENNKPLNFEARLKTAKGNIKWCRAMGRAIHRDGKCIKLCGTLQDITERKQAEAAVLDSQTRHRLLVATIPDLVWLKDTEGVYLSCNPTFERFFGATESAIVGKTDYHFKSRELADFFRENDRKAMDANGPTTNEEWLTFADGSYHGLFETIKTPMHDADGTLIGVLGIARDISERKKAENALKENEQRYKSAQRMGQVGNWEYNITTEQFWGSDEARRIYGFDPETQKFTTEEIEGCIPERKRVHQALVDLIEKNTPYDIEFEIRPLTGPSQKIIRSIAEIARDESGVPLKVVGVLQDITKQKTAENAKVILERQLHQSQKMESIGTLAGGIAHDFNNILASIIGYTELALDDVAKGSAMADNLEEVYSAGIRARDLVKQILAFARQTKAENKPVQLRLIVKEVLKFIRSSLPTTIDILSAMDSDSVIMANTTQMHQVIMNLCTNAAHAMEEKGGILRVGLKDITIHDATDQKKLHLPYGPYIELTISDTGTGIAPDIIGSIFEPYFTTKGLGEGTGLGLAMVHGIVESCGGRITVDSTPGKGTTFTLYLPITQKSHTHRPYESEALPSGKERILFVDDEAAIAKMGKQLLERLGYCVTISTRSRAALELFRSQPHDFDLVITDMTMPHMTGDQLAVELMTIRPGIPVILCTGYSKKISDDRASAIGIKAMVYKPVVKNNLAKTVRKVLDETKNNIGICSAST